MNRTFAIVLTLCLLALNRVRGETAPIVLTNAAQVKALSVQAASKGIPVRLQAVVTAEGQNGIMVQDGEVGIYLWSGTNNPPGGITNSLGGTNNLSWVRRGDLVEVDGNSDPGEFAPIIRPRNVTKIGTAPLPDPKPVTYDQLENGSTDGQWVEISGIVRDCENVSTYHFKLTLATGGSHLIVECFGATNFIESLVDSEVRMRGICFYQFNRSRQILSPLMMVADTAQITKEKPAPADPFAAPLRHPESLLVYSQEDSRRHRVRVQGTVLHKISGQTLWLRDAGHGLRVETRQKLDCAPGDQVEAIGFPGNGDYSPILENALLRKISGITNMPAPLVVTGKSLALEHDADLVQLDAKLVEATHSAKGWDITLDWQEIELHATLVQLTAVPLGWEPGSRVRLTGICQVTTETPSVAGGIREPRDFQILMRSANDLRVLQKPPWWTPARIFILLIAATGISLVTAAFIAGQARYRLREQAARRRMAETEFSAMLAERNRIAREIHDTLAQGLGAISMHLEMVKEKLGHEPDKVAKHLDIAHQMARQSLGEARSSIWNMRSQVLENADLGEALQGISRQLTDGTEIQVQFNITGNMRRLAPVIENNLLRVGQEAITNAVKHAHAKNISVTLDFKPAEAGLTVRDDGRGFDPAHLPAGTHFGMLGQRERTAQMGGKLEVDSSPGRGTEVKVRIPIYE